MLTKVEKTKIAVFVSGGGTNLQALIDAQKSGKITHGEISLVVSSNSDAFAVVRATMAGIPSKVVCKKDYKSQTEYEDAVIALLAQHGIELIVLAGFMTILTEHFTSKYPNRIINVHPSLIPSFCGKGFYGLKVHEEALKYGVKITGATVHFVNEIPDGGQIILQKAVIVRKGETPKSLQSRVMKQAEWIILPRAVEMVSKDIMKSKAN